VLFPLAEFAILMRSSTERHRMRIILDKLTRKSPAKKRPEAVAESSVVSQAP
jgi:hypothetical protein